MRQIIEQSGRYFVVNFVLYIFWNKTCQCILCTDTTYVNVFYVLILHISIYSMYWYHTYPCILCTDTTHVIVFYVLIPHLIVFYVLIPHMSLYSMHWYYTCHCILCTDTTHVNVFYVLIPHMSLYSMGVGGAVRFLVVGTIGQRERPPRGQLWMEQCLTPLKYWPI